MELVVLVYSPLASSRKLLLLDKRQYKHHQRYIVLDKRQMLYLFSNLPQVLLLIHLDQELYKFLHIKHTQYNAVH